MKSGSTWLVSSLISLAIAFGVTSAAYGQVSTNKSYVPPSFGAVDACAGRGMPGSSSYGACQLQQQTLNQSVDRAPDLSAINGTERLGIEQACASDASRGDAVYTACLRRQLVMHGSDPVTPVRRVPDTQRKPDSLDHSMGASGE